MCGLPLGPSWPASPPRGCNQTDPPTPHRRVPWAATETATDTPPGPARAGRIERGRAHLPETGRGWNAHISDSTQFRPDARSLSSVSQEARGFTDVR